MSLKIYTKKTFTNEVKKKLFERSFVDFREIINALEPQMNAVKQRGDVAILEKYAGRNIPIAQLRLTSAEIKQAYQQVSAEFVEAIKTAIQQCRTVHQQQYDALLQQLSGEKKASSAIGKVWRQWRPIEKVGVYVPGGGANYPSSLMMSVVPAQVAGCTQIVVCTPPLPDGSLPAEVIVTADILKVTNVLFKVGGPQAIAAMTYGTESIPAVYKIVGPGNQYVTSAKIAVFPQVAIDMPAGPSENLIIADETANPLFVSADLLADAEHGPDSTSIMLTTSTQLAKQVQKMTEQLMKKYTTNEVIATSLTAYGAIIVVDSLQEACALSNEYAPEHLQLPTREPRLLAAQINNAGSVFIGNWTSKSAGDYATGANHVLPTGMTARAFSPLSVETFGKLVQFQQTTRSELKTLQKTIETLGTVEKLPAHVGSTSLRFTNR